MSSAAEFPPDSRALKTLEEAADRGRPLESPLAPVSAVTIHPSAILRLRDHDEREAELAAFVADLEVVATSLGAPK